MVASSPSRITLTVILGTSLALLLTANTNSCFTARIGGNKLGNLFGLTWRPEIRRSCCPRPSRVGMKIIPSAGSCPTGPSSFTSPSNPGGLAGNCARWIHRSSRLPSRLQASSPATLSILMNLCNACDSLVPISQNSRCMNNCLKSILMVQA